MRGVVVAFAVASLLFLAACGSSGAVDDPFVGTWRPVDAPSSPPRLVVAQAQDGYEAFSFGGGAVVGPIPLQRDGDTLVFPAQNGVERQTFTFHSDMGGSPARTVPRPASTSNSSAAARRIRR